jgi:hypothetical protein
MTSGQQGAFPAAASEEFGDRRFRRPTQRFLNEHDAG